MGVQTPIASLNPFTMSGWDPVDTISLAIEPLARIHPIDGSFIPCLAKSWKVSKDKKSVEVSLREGVKFHDGVALTAEDVKFTLEAYRDDRYGGAIWRPMWEDILEVKVTGPLTFKFTTRKVSYSDFASFMSELRILPKHYYSKLESKAWNGRIVGTGPYQVERFDSNKAVEMKSYGFWWGSAEASQSRPEKLLIKTVTDSRLALEMIRKGELDYYPITDQNLFLQINKEKSAHLQVVRLRGLGGTNIGISLNLTHPLFQSANVRRALLMLWNRERINAKLFEGQMSVAIDSFDPNRDSHPGGKPVPYDPNEALKLLAKDGWEDSDGDGQLDKDINGRVNLSFSILMDKPLNERWITLFQEDLRKYGIEVKIDKVADDTMSWSRLKQKKFEAWAESGAPDKGVTQGWKTGAYYNFYGYSNPKVDALLEKIESEFDPSKRKKIQHELIRLVRADSPSLPGLQSAESYFALSRRLKPDSVWPKSPQFWKDNK